MANINVDKVEFVMVKLRWFTMGFMAALFVCTFINYMLFFG
jgi:hypothetical protein